MGIAHRAQIPWLWLRIMPVERQTESKGRLVAVGRLLNKEPLDLCLIVLGMSE